MLIPHRKLAWILIPVFLLVLIVEVQTARDRLRADRILRQVESLTISAVQSGRVSRTVTAANLRLLREAEMLVPYEISIPIARGSQYLLMKRPEEALEAYSAALELEVRPEIYLNMGRAHRQAGDDDAAVHAYVQAVRLSPRLRKEVPAELRRKVNDRLRGRS